jgi:hypothetical protein
MLVVCVGEEVGVVEGDKGGVDPEEQGDKAAEADSCN